MNVDNINDLNSELKLLKSENEEHIKDISFLNDIIENLVNKNEEIEQLYIESNLKIQNLSDELRDSNLKVNDSNLRIQNLSVDLQDSNLKIQDLIIQIENLKKIISDKEELEIFKNDSYLSNFKQFLFNSYLSPKIDVPFSIEHKRSFLFMEIISNYLIENLSKLNTKPLVSVIMPVYNRENVVKQAIDSVLNQTYQNIELIIIDDGSTDGTINILNSISDNRVKVFLNENNEGASFSRNRGLKESSGEYIAYLDSDNDWNSNYISAMVGAFIELPKADALYSGQILFEQYGSKPTGIRFSPFNKSLLHNKNYIDMNCFCHKREVYEKIGGFNKNLKRLVDWDYILKISNNFNIYSVPVLLSNYYSNNADNRIDSLTINKNKYNQYILNKNKSFTFKRNLEKNVNIIIFNQNDLSCFKTCIKEILSIYEGLKIIIFNMNNDSQLNDYFNLLILKNENIKLVNCLDNLQFNEHVNELIKLIDDDSDLLLLNSNASLTDNSIETMQYFANKIENTGLIVPQQVLMGGLSDINRHVPYADSFYECDVNVSMFYKNIKEIPVFYRGDILELTYAPFFCIYLKKEIFNKINCFENLILHYDFFDVLLSDYVTNILNLNIYHVSEVIVRNHQAVNQNFSNINFDSLDNFSWNK